MEKTEHVSENEYVNAAKYLMYLLKSALHQSKIRKEPSKCTWEQVWELAQKNNVEATVSEVVAQYEGNIPSELRKKWRKAGKEILYRQICFEMERENILQGLAEKGIAWLPLKGINLVQYYPRPGMRWMCDNDILCGYIEENEKGGYKICGEDEKAVSEWKEKAKEDIREIMENLGFSLKGVGSCHDLFQKGKIIKFEMHSQLFSRMYDGYFENPWESVIPDPVCKGQYHFSDEDEYLYMIGHAYKHFSDGGCGVRTLADEYVFLQKKNTLDWDYIKRETAKCGIDSFEETLRKVALHAFSENTSLTETEWKFALHMIGCGTYGSIENQVGQKQQRIREEQKCGRLHAILIYLKNRIVTDEYTLKEAHPFVDKYRVFLPLLPVYRIVRGMILHPKRLVGEWRVMIRRRG